LSYYFMNTFALVVLLFGFFLLARVRRNFLFLQRDRETITEIVKDFESLKERLDDDSGYLRFSQLALFKKDSQGLREKLRKVKNLFLRRDLQKKLNEIIGCERNLEKTREQVNERFFLKEKERCRNIFYDNQGRDLLTEEQVRAVLTDDNRNLVIAGAGSGKTRVIEFKVRYLVQGKKVNPQKIILLSFSRKSAGDLVRKISEHIPGIEVRTIHAFSAQILGDQKSKIFDESNNEIYQLITKALAQTLKERAAFRIFNEFYEKFFCDIKALIFYKSLDGLRADLKKYNSKLIEVDDRFEEIKARRALKTLKGDYVRSIDERYIADFLFLQNIEYEYERKYPNSSEPYYPDFYLADYDVYLEHFAITKDGGPPTYFENPQKYMNGIKWKRDLHQRQNTRMVETESYRLNAGNTSEYLGKILKENGIEINMNLEEDGAYTKISVQFSRFFARFYNSFKLSGFSLGDLKIKFLDPRYSLFLRLFEKFLSHYERLVLEENKMDFSDLILQATTKYRNHPPKTFDYIIVDEFQDTSNLAMGLLNLIYQSNSDSSFFSVGDDWQSIYGFNGSDVTILSEYETRYAGVSIRQLNSNFRSHPRIVELGKKFISKNPAQIPKDVVSKNSEFKDSDIGFISFDQMAAKIESIPDDESILVLYRYNTDCPVERGIFKECFYFDKNRKPVKKATCKKNISLLTIHGSKGLEARHVFILFPDGVKRKFPSEMEDHFVFNMLKNSSDSFPFSEERRLMYVAITRAEQNLYFVSPNGNDPNSVFWDELREMV
jgi:DNA helicase IV